MRRGWRRIESMAAKGPGMGSRSCGSSPKARVPPGIAAVRVGGRAGGLELMSLMIRMGSWLVVMDYGKSR